MPNKLKVLDMDTITNTSTSMVTFIPSHLKQKMYNIFPLFPIFEFSLTYL